jgi:hypothetical protein
MPAECFNPRCVWYLMPQVWYEGKIIEREGDVVKVRGAFPPSLPPSLSPSLPPSLPFCLPPFLPLKCLLVLPALARCISTNGQASTTSGSLSEPNDSRPISASLPSQR